MDNKGIIQIFNLPENLSLNETKKTPNKKKKIKIHLNFPRKIKIYKMKNLN